MKIGLLLRNIRFLLADGVNLLTTVGILPAHALRYYTRNYTFRTEGQAKFQSIADVTVLRMSYKVTRPGSTKRFPFSVCLEVNGSFHGSTFTSIEVSGSFHGNIWKLPLLLVQVEACTSVHQLKLPQPHSAEASKGFHRTVTPVV